MNKITRSILLIFLLLAGGRALAQPTANFSANVVVGCAPLLVQFIDASTGSPTSYQWNLGNSVTSVLQNPSTTYTIPGTYTVTLTVSNASGSNTKTVTSYITVHSNPIVDFTANDTAGCPPHPVVFTDGSTPGTPGAATYSWSFGNGNVSTTQSPSHTYTAVGYYNVTLVVTNSGGCVTSLTKPNYIHVYNPPIADFTATPTANCITPSTVAFTETVTGNGPMTYNWNYGDGNTGTGTAPTHTYTTAGTYTVTLLVTDVNGCMDTVIKPAYVTVGTLVANFNSSAGCENTPKNFSSTSIGASSVLWDFGDGGTSTSNNPTHVFTSSGVFNVKLKAFSSTCVDSITIPVTINPQPIGAFNFTPSPPCPAPITLQFNNTTTGATNYFWSFGDGGNSIVPSPVHNYVANGPYLISLIATSADGCKDTVYSQDTLFDLTLNASATPKAGCVPLEVHFKTVTRTSFPPPGKLYPYATAFWSWDFGDGGTSSLDTPVHIYTTPGTYTVTVTITTINGCVEHDTLTVDVGTLPVAGFTASPDTVCVDQSVTFVNTSTGATSYFWEFGDMATDTATNPGHAYSVSGTYTVVLHAINNGCEDTVVTTTILVRPPTALFTPVFDCDTPLLVRFNDNATIEATSRIWFFGDNTTSTDSMPTHIYPTYGNYTVTLVTFNSNYGCSDTLSKSIRLFSPTASFSTPDTAICRHDSITFFPTYSDIATQYDWHIGVLSFIDTFQNFGYTFHQNGIYPVRVVITDEHFCKDTFTRPNYVLVAKPTAAFTGVPAIGCIPMNVLFTENSTNTPGAYSVTRDWTFGNGNTANVNTATTNNLYNTVGLYNVTMIVTDNVGCKDTLTKNNYIDARQPIAAFNATDTAICIGQLCSFINTSSGTTLSYSWDFGDGGTSTQPNPTHAYSQTGTYTVQLIVFDPSGCRDTLVRTGYIDVSKPTAVFTMSDTMAICPPLNVLFTNPSVGGVSYAWDFGNSSGSPLQNPTAIYTMPGIYNISLVVTNAQGCTDTAYGKANVLGYAGGLTYTPLGGCAPLEIQFTANLTNVPTIIWDFSDGVTAPANGLSTTTHTYVTPGAYIPKLILSDGAGCLNSSAGLDTIRVDGVLAGFTTSPPCVETLVNFTDTSFSFFSPVTTWSWSFNNGQQLSNSKTPSNLYTSPGTYPVHLIATNSNGCSDTIDRDITIYSLPIIGAGPDTSVCSGDAAYLAGSGGVSYNWTPSNYLSCTACPDPLASPPANTTYIVHGTDIHGCMNTDSVTVKVQYITTSFVEDGGNICDDSTFQLLAYGAHRYEWTPAETLDNDKVANPKATPHETTTYVVMAWEGSCPPDSHKVQVTVFPKPVVYAGTDQTIVAGTEVMLNATGSNLSSFEWSPLATLSCETCSNPIARPVVTTTYQVIGKSLQGCKNADTVTIHILCDQSQLFIPNLFSPNGDGNNDVFYPRGEGLQSISSFRVYNRWGEVVFDRKGTFLNDQSGGWDGTMGGNKLSPDTYIYVIDGICSTGEPISWKGDITLIR